MDQFILLYPPNETAFKEFLNFSLYLIKNSNYIPVFFIEKKLFRFIDDLESLQVKYITECEKCGQEEKQKAKRVSILKKIGNKMDAIRCFKHKIFNDYFVGCSIYFLIDLIITIKQTVTKKRVILPFLQHYNFVALLLYSDRMIGWEQVLIDYFKKKNLPRIVLPVALSSVEGGVKLRDGKKQYLCSKSFRTPLPNHLIRLINPNWCLNIKSESISFYPPGKAIAGYLLKNISLNPWFIGGGYSTKVAVDSEKTKKEYILNNIEDEKIVVTGIPSYDYLFDVLDNRDYYRLLIYRENNFDEKRDLIICALPQLAEHKLISWDENFEINSFIIETLSNSGLNVLISLHPKSKEEDYLILEKKYNCKISKRNLNTILPLADIFVATYSSTVVWAIMCRIPSIVVDFYNFNYSIFNDFGGVLRAYSKNEFEHYINKVVEDKNYYSYLVNEHIMASKHMPRFDGKSRENILKLIDEQIEGGSGCIKVEKE